MSRRLNLPVPDIALLEQLAASRRLGGMFAGKSTFLLLRKTYFDTPDGLLRERDMTLLLRVEAQGPQVVELTIQDVLNLQGVVEETVLKTPVVGGGLYSTICGDSEVATRVREVADPAALRPQLAIDIDREMRDLRAWWWGRPQHRVSFDHIVGHAPGVTRASYEITLMEVTPGRTSLEALGQRLRTKHSIEIDGHDTSERMRVALTGTTETRIETPHEARVALLILQDGKVALLDGKTGLTLPCTRGAGEELAREFLRELSALDSGGVELDLIGFAPMRGGGAGLEVWLHARPPMGEELPAFTWVPLDELMERVGAPQLRDPELVAALLLLVRSEIGLRLLRDSQVRAEEPIQLPLAHRDPGFKVGSADDDFLDLELSILDFNQRVLELAEDDSVPLLERFFFLSIFLLEQPRRIFRGAGRSLERGGRSWPHGKGQEDVTSTTARSRRDPGPRAHGPSVRVPHAYASLKACGAGDSPQALARARGRGARRALDQVLSRSLPLADSARDVGRPWPVLPATAKPRALARYSTAEAGRVAD